MFLISSVYTKTERDRQLVYNEFLISSIYTQTERDRQLVYNVFLISSMYTQSRQPGIRPFWPKKTKMCFVLLTVNL